MPTDTEDARQQVLQQTRKRRFKSALSGEEGMATAEYAIGTIAAASLGMVLMKVVTSDDIHKMILSIIKSALNLAS
ncbi:DUF4244 domain-containing protein [Flindersiella endophytica]